MKFFEDLNFNAENFDIFSKTSTKFIQDIFSLAFVDKEELKVKLFNRLDVPSLISSNQFQFKDPEVVEFLLDLFEFFNDTLKYEKNYKFSISKEKILERNEFLRKAIFRSLLDTDSSLLKYRFLIVKFKFLP